MARKRWRPKKEDELKGTGYDSMLEKNLHSSVLKDCSFHCKDDLVSYSVPHTYEPDFSIVKDGKKYLIETKGRFNDSSEARKYLFIREYLPENTELVFIMQKANTRFPFARKRKDGTYATHEEYLDKHGFRHWNVLNFNMDEL